MREKALFGPAGTCERAAAEKIKTTEKYIEWLCANGADAFEYQCGRGVNIKEEKARIIGKKAADHKIALSVHAPYYISLASAEEEKRDNSIRYILDSARAASWMGAERIVVHPGGIGKMSREDAYALAETTLRRALEAVRAEGLDTIICPEVMGKINQLGDLSEVLRFCSIDESLIPCVDFGHLNSRLHGEMDYKKALDEIFSALGEDRARLLHIHFSKIEYSKGGEVRHLTFADTQFGPDFEPLIDEIVSRNMTPTVICESAGTQTDDALSMKRLYVAQTEKGDVLS